VLGIHHQHRHQLVATLLALALLGRTPELHLVAAGRH
jgi:hypothetical protein